MRDCFFRGNAVFQRDRKLHLVEDLELRLASALKFIKKSKTNYDNLINIE